MTKPQLELADVVRRFLGPYKEQFGHLMLPSHHRALQDIVACMTEDMGGERYHCNDCNEAFWIYHGCRNRSCPKCYGRQTAQWLKSRSTEALPVFPRDRYGPQRVTQPVSTPSENALWSAHEDGRRERA